MENDSDDLTDTLTSVIKKSLVEESYDHECVWCHKKYSKNSNLNRHLRKCPVRIEKEVNRCSEIDLLKEELNEPCKVIATGGLANLFAGSSETLERVEPHLTLEGLRLLFETHKAHR